jgi:hypothetical protein
MNFFTKKILFLMAIIAVHSTASSQINETESYYHRMGNFGQHQIGLGTLSTGNTGTGDNVNITYHRCNWTADPDDATKTLKGNVTTYFKTIIANLDAISFDFNSTSFNNDSLKVYYHGTVCNVSFPTTGNFDILNITLPVKIAAIGTLDSITIIYQGIPPASNGDALGYQRDVDNVNNNFIYTLSESYEDKDWWPCKADMQDKIDSLDINVTVPKAFWVAANGLMVDSTITGTTRTFKFKHRYPIASYLVALGIAKFKKYDLGTLTVGSKNTPFTVNLFPDKSTSTENNILAVLSNHKLVFDALNGFYGDYPYANEKHGFYEFGFGGGMEHQTFSGIGGSSFQSNSVLAHELGHQWFGDKVSFATWNHLWLAEGFATYSEVLMAEFVPSIGVNFLNKLANNKSTARANNISSIYLTNINSSNTIWTNDNTSAVYNRGCMVVSMLRSLLGDSKFFAACKNYLSDTAIAYKAAVTADLQRNMEVQLGESMTSFFTEWIMKKGSPKYSVQWGNVGKRINLKLTQTVSSGISSATASTFFPMPVIVKIEDSMNGIDTIVIIYHKAASKLAYLNNGIGATVNSNIISYNLSFTPNKITFDPENRTMATATVSYAAILPIIKIDIEAKKNITNNLVTTTIFSIDNLTTVELEKSIDGVRFKSLGVMKNTVLTNDTKQYQLADENLANTTIYYRVKVNSSNATTSFSKIIIVENKAPKTNISLSPNPANKLINIKVDGLMGDNEILIRDYLGRKIFTQTINNTQIAPIKVEHFAKGIYVVELWQENKLIATEKLVVN